MGLSKTIWTNPTEYLTTQKPENPILFFAPSVLQGMAQGQGLGGEAVAAGRGEAGEVAGGRLDLDHVGAEVGEHPAAVRARQHPRQVEHPDPVERRSHRPIVAGRSAGRRTPRWRGGRRRHCLIGNL